MLKWVTLKDYGVISLSAATQTQQDVIPRVLGSIFALQFNFTQGTGTGSPAAASIIEASVNDIYITDVNRVKVLDLQGVDIPDLTYNFSPSGVFSTPTVFSTSSATDQYCLYWPIRVEDQPLNVSVVIDTLAAVSGGTTSATTMDFSINVLYDDATDPAATLRETRSDNAVSSGANDLSNRLGQGLTTYHVSIRNTIAAYSQSDTNVTNFQFEAGGLVQIENMTVQAFKSYEAVNTVSGHQPGYYPLPISQPFVTTAATKLVATVAASLTFRLYQFYIL